jgi:hypothetical protein
MHREVCTRKNVVIDNKPRPVYRVGIAVQVDGVLWASVEGKRLHPFQPCIDITKEYPVFIQSHALERMKERLFPIDYYEMLLSLSFEAGEISRGPSGMLFFSVGICDCKLGYMLADFTGSELIVRSFLFITNTGTNEGNAFNERLRLKAYSKTYFGLDSLETYLATDICTDPFFRSVLTECGCEGLIQFKETNSYETFESEKKFSENLRRELALEEEVWVVGEVVTAGQRDSVTA